LPAGVQRWYGVYALPPTERDARVAGESDGSSPQLAKPGACAPGLVLGEAGAEDEDSRFDSPCTIKRFDAPEHVLAFDNCRLEVIPIGDRFIGKGSYGAGWTR
jgi:hypothetical protein